MGAIYRGGEPYSHGGFGTPASDITFSPGLSGMVSKDVNAAILELANIVNTAVAQFAMHKYEYTGANSQTIMDFIKESLTKASRASGGFHIMYITVATNNHYIGITTTADSKCSFTLHSVEVPSKMYYGYFDDLNTASGFKMYQINGDSTELFSKSGFTL